MKKKRRSRRKGGWQRGLLIFLCVLLSLVLLALIGLAVLLNDWLGAIERLNPEQESTMSSQEASQWIEDNRETEESIDTNIATVDPSDITWETEPSQDPTDPTQPSTEAPVIDLIGDEEHIVNILLIGSDRRSSSERGRSDAMILCTFNTQTNEFTMTSFLRDLYVQIPGYYSNRINAAYAFGGVSLLDETLEKNFHIHVDANVVVDFSSFTHVIDLVGGVPIWLTAAEAAHLNEWYGWSLTEGSNWLNGEQALGYSRIRKIDSDFNRTNRQRTVLSALVKRATQMELTQVLGVAKQVLQMVSTDLSDAEILGYVTQLFPVLVSAELQTQAIPQSGTYQDVYIDGMRVLLPDLGAARAFLRETLAG